MLTAKETVECLELAKKQVSRMSWALQLHVPNGLGGGASEVVRNEDSINDWIDDAIQLLSLHLENR